MNTLFTLGLELHHHELVQRFQSTAPYLISIPVIFPLISHKLSYDQQFFGGMKTSHAILIGISNNPSITTSQIGATYYTNTHDAHFKKEESRRSNGTFHLLLQALDTYLVKNDIRERFEISWISPVEQGHGFGFIGHLATGIAQGVLQILGNIPSQESLEGQHIEEILQLAHHLESSYYNGKECGAISKILYQKDSGPHFCSFNKRKNGGRLVQEIHLLQTSESTMQQANELGMKFGMIYSGFPLYRNTSNSLKNSRILENNQLQHFLRTHQIGNDESIESPFIKFQDTQRIQTTIFDTLTLLDSRFIHLLYSYLQDIHNKYKLQEFLEFVTKYRGVLECYEQPHQFIQDFQNAFQIMRLNSNETLSLIPRYAGKNGGSFMFYASESLSEESLSRTLRELERSYPKISLEFANFRDGIEKSNIQLIKNLYSTSKKDVSGKRMMVLTQENGQRQFFGEHEFQIHNSQQIILDLSDDKIYIRGRKCTSKDLPAQNRTISILTHLLKHKGKHIPAKYFGISSYTTSKNEMISKIISPLKKICLNELNLELPLFCEGNLTDFSLYLDDKQLPISILEST